MIKKSTLLKKVREALGITGIEFANRLKISQSNYSAMENGSRVIGKNIERNILTTFRLNSDWWETGEGDMFLSEPDIPHPSAIASAGSLVDKEFLVKHVATQDELIRAKEEIIRLKDQLLEKQQRENENLKRENERLKNPDGVSDKS